MKLTFYTRTLERCPCGRPAEYDVLATGNASYGKYCKSCVLKKVRDLQKYWDNQDAKLQEQQLRSQ